MTKLLYNESAYIKEFDAVVLSCEAGEAEGTYIVTLDQTAFFPEQGGQYADEGTVGTVHVIDAQFRNGIVYHITDAPLTVGESYFCCIDFEKRYDRMQNHTGEHIVSGYLHAAFGYENVGFHLNDVFMTLDTSGELSKTQLLEVELYANRTVQKNLPVCVTYPTEKDLKTLEYRSKLELTDDVRIVIIPDVDVCACCAPHVAVTGEVGMIKIVDAIRYKGGMRLTLLCGQRAVRDYQAKHADITDIAVLLSVKSEEAFSAVKRLQKQLTDNKNELHIVKRELLELKMEALSVTDGNLCLFEVGADNNTLREMVNAGLEKCGGVCAAFSGTDTEGYQFVIGSREIPLRARVKEITAALNGRGGGSDQMLSGTVKADAETIRSYIEQFR